MPADLVLRAPAKRRRVSAQTAPLAAQVALGGALAVLVRRAFIAFAARFAEAAAAIETRDRDRAHRAADRAADAARAVLTAAGIDGVLAAGARRATDFHAAQLARQVGAALGVQERAIPIAPPRPERLADFTANARGSLAGVAEDLRRAAHREIATKLDARAIAPAEARADAEAPIEHATNIAQLVGELSVSEKEQLAAFLTATHAAGEISNRQRAATVAFLRERLAMGERRAKSVARDQIAKLVGLVNMDRQVALGITSYTWGTRRDRKVRPTHKARRGRVFRWDKPPPDGHPGIPHGCRCGADPVLDDLRKIAEELRSRPYALGGVRRRH